MRVHSYIHTHTQTHTNPNKQTWMRKRVRDVASSLVLSRHVLRCVLHIVYYTDTQSSIHSFFVFFVFVSIFISLSLSLLICWSTLPYTYAVFVYWYLFRFDMFVCKCALFTVSGVVRSFVRIWTTGALYTYRRRLGVLMHVFYLFLVRFICLTAQQQISYFNRNYRHFVGCIGLDFDFVVWMCVRASAASNQNLNTYTHFCHSTVSFNCLVQRLWMVSVCLQKFPWLRDHATMKRTKQGLILSMNKNKANYKWFTRRHIRIHIQSHILHAHKQAAVCDRKKNQNLLYAMCVGGVTLAIPILLLFPRLFQTSSLLRSFACTMCLCVFRESSYVDHAK